MEIVINGEKIEVTEEHKEVLRATASNDPDGYKMRQKAIAQVLERAWQAGVLEPDLLGNIYNRVVLPAGIEAKFPLDFYAPENEGAYVAFVLPKEGAIPDRVIEGDEVRVNTYKVGNSISWSLDYARDARWDVIARAIEVFTNGFVRKLNDDGWHVILAAANEGTGATNIDDGSGSTTAGAFTKPLLLNLMASIKRRTGGRNTRLNDLYVSPEAINDIRNFTNTEIDEISRRELVTAGEDVIPRLYGVRLHEMLEFGVGQEYEGFITNTLARAHDDSKVEWVVGLDSIHRDAFVMPVREEMKMFDDDSLHRSMKAGVYGWMELGFANLDTRRAIVGQL